jgi:tetratricopeptide (TPR) repeat protein
VKLLRIIFLIAIFAVAAASHAATNDWFEQGDELVRSGKFSEAATVFAKAAQAQPATGTLINLGLAEWQRGHAGAAILAWEQARWIDPFAERAETNLKFARAVAQVDAPQLKWFEDASVWLSPTAWLWLAGASLWLAMAAMILPRAFRWRRTSWHQLLAAFSIFIFLASLTANVGIVSRTEIGFVLRKDAALRLTPTQTGEVISTLAAGEPARKLRSHGNYFLIQMANESGWIERNAFGLVSE